MAGAWQFDSASPQVYHHPLREFGKLPQTLSRSKDGESKSGSTLRQQIPKEEEISDSGKNKQNISNDEHLYSKPASFTIPARGHSKTLELLTLHSISSTRISVDLLMCYINAFSKQIFWIPTSSKTDSNALLDLIMTCMIKNLDRDVMQGQQRLARLLALPGSSGWKLCKQLKHYKQASTSQRSMGVMTESQILSFMERQFDSTHLPAGIPLEMSDMKLEENRLKSFSLDGRPAFSEQCQTGQLPAVLAANGFFYMQDGDRVKCAFCLGVLHSWKPEESVPESHRLRFSTCPFLLGLDVGNRPITTTASDAADKLLKVAVACSEDNDTSRPLEVVGCTQPHPDVECCFELMSRPRPPVSVKVSVAACRRGVTDNLELFARSLYCADTAARYHPMRHPAWRHADSREETLARGSHAVPADLLACAGFFLNTDLQTTCYWCGLQLLHWLGNDDPWIEHARWSPRCCHLLLERGHEFVLAARAACPPYQLQQLLRPCASPAGQLQTDSACAADLPETPGSNMSTVTGSSHLIDYRIEPRYFKAREDSPSTLAVLQVGCDPDDAKTAQFLQLKSCGDDFPTYELFLHGVLSQSRRRQKLGISGREFYEQVQREQAQSCCREPKPLGEDDLNWRACKVCMDKVINVTLLDCKHLCCCSDCAKRLDACPLCRSPIRATMLVNVD